ncbi:hypothetical protein ACJJTC_012342 [Scirpophaga incertulas]
MTLKAKSNISGYRRSLQQTGGGEKPPSPTAEDEAIMAITPIDFEIGSNPFDSDAASTVHVEVPNVEIVEINEPEPGTSAPISKNEPGRKTKKGKSSTLDTRMDIIETNKEYNKKLLEMEEELHSYKIKLIKLKIEKTQLEIEVLKNNTCKCNDMQNH